MDKHYIEVTPDEALALASVVSAGLVIMSDKNTMKAAAKAQPTLSMALAALIMQPNVVAAIKPVTMKVLAATASSNGVNIPQADWDKLNADNPLEG